MLPTLRFRRLLALLACACLLPSLGAQNPAGALSGKRVFLSPGHGYYWHTTFGWTTQRPLIDGLIEDIHTNEIVMDHLLELLEQAGAQVIPCRAPSRTTEEHVIDDAQGAPAVTLSGSWPLSTFSGFGGGGYRYASTTPAGSGFVAFEATITQSDLYPVYVAFRAGANRTTAAEIEIHHAGGPSLRTVDQTRDDRSWVYLGRFPFRAGESARVVVTDRSSTGGIVVADQVRIGDGMGSIARGGSVSGQPRWLECSRYWAQLSGAPPSVYDTSGQDNSDDVTCRPRFSEWRGGGDAYLSIHTNAGGGSGTSTWIYNGGATPGSATLRSLVQNRVVSDLRAGWDPAWVDGGEQSANFGELRLLSTMPGALVELAFHDDIGGDIEAIHHPRFRRLVARALYRALASYLAPGQPWTLEPPEALALRNDGLGGLVASWAAVPGASGYWVEVSEDGFAYDDGRFVPTPTLALSGLPHGATRYVRVRAVNAGGRGRVSSPVGARTSPGGPAPLLLVDGFDRRDRSLKAVQNPRDWLARLGPTATAVADAGYPFDGATNEALTTGLATVFLYPCVGWICGEESTGDESFSVTEQAILTTYINFGGRFFYSGSEVGWDLDAQGSAQDRAFYEQVLGQDYVADDAGTYLLQPVATGPLAPLPGLAFDDGSTLYDVDYPDVVAPSASTPGQIVLRYAGGAGAAVLRADGRVLGLGFPIHAVTDPSLRRELMARILDLMVPLPLRRTGPLVPGQAIDLELSWPGRPGAGYVLACSASSDPGLPLGDGRHLPLNPDPLLDLSLLGAPFFADFSGTLDATGKASAQILVPPVPGLSGLSFRLSAVALGGPSGIAEVAPWVRIVLP